MREDVVPVTLSTVPESFCMARGCALRGTERWTGETYATAICQTQGARITNGRDSDPSDDANPDLFASSLYYGVRLDDGTTGYVSEVWTVASQRGGLGLPPC
jgi:hypothetical protein